MLSLCPECKAQYRKGMITCSECNVALIAINRTDDKYIGDAYIRETRRQRQAYGDKLVRKSVRFTKALPAAIFIGVVEYYYRSLISLKAAMVMSVVVTMGVVIYAYWRHISAAIEALFDIEVNSFVSKLERVTKVRRKKR